MNIRPKGFHNIPDGMPDWYDGIIDLKNGEEVKLNVNFIGDSITQGFNATDRPTRGFTRLFHEYMKHYGDRGYGLKPPFEYETGWTFTGTGWTTDPTHGIMLYSKTTSTENDSCTVTFTGDLIEVYYLSTPSSATIETSIDSGEATEHDTSGETTQLNTILITTTTGEHTLTITITSENKPFYLIGVIPQNDVNNGIMVNNCGLSSTTIIGTMTYGGYGGGPDSMLNTLSPTINSIKPDLTVIGYIANDYNIQVPLANYEEYLNTLTEQALLQGEALLLSVGMWGGTSRTIPQRSYVDIMRDVAVDNDCGFIDIFGRWQNLTYAETEKGYITAGDDHVHPTDKGHRNIAKTLYHALNRTDWNYD